jgi:hypothetical protein
MLGETIMSMPLERFVSLMTENFVISFGLAVGLVGGPKNFLIGVFYSLWGGC